MSVDYSANFGLGILITKEMIATAIEKGLFTEEDYEEDPYSCLGSLDGVYIAEAGSYYYGETRYYATVPTDNYLEQTSGAVDAFILVMKEHFGIELEYKDLNIVGGILVS